MKSTNETILFTCSYLKLTSVSKLNSSNRISYSPSFEFAFSFVYNRTKDLNTVSI